ncbi:hypothetical protein LEP1GSC059_4657 [Leptospira noguchii serovar Panama str. CZ214]|uniref:Uncharacterized protein n=1 Tax=Leptospira noguchii serovar Panama str. CZ214 TaxID=1001595 RepID=T0FKE5_9LEPT|nr:hypothetical protein LEP1GSC059_4657 [Leptospira noguchii serovar Panama str. CZ214]
MWLLLRKAFENNIINLFKKLECRISFENAINSVWDNTICKNFSFSQNLYKRLKETKF